MYYYALPLLIVLPVIVLIVLLLLIVLIVLFPGEGARSYPHFIFQCNVELFHCTTILHTSRSPTPFHFLCVKFIFREYSRTPEA